MVDSDDGEHYEGEDEPEYTEAEMAVMEQEKDVGWAEFMNQCMAEVRGEAEKTNRAIMLTIRDLGADTRIYQRERSKALKAVISEIYSEPRVTKALKMIPTEGGGPGFALDLTTEDEEGRPWDFAKAECRERARKMVKEQRPMSPIGSPACTAFSSWQALSDTKRDPAAVHREYISAMVHLRSACELYKLQRDEGRYFLHGHLA